MEGDTIHIYRVFRVSNETRESHGRLIFTLTFIETRQLFLRRNEEDNYISYLKDNH